MSFPVVIAGFFQVNYDTIGGKILLALNSSSWFNPERPAYSVGLIVYIALIIVFAYFYTSITFNPLEVANNMKKSGGFIPGCADSDLLQGRVRCAGILRRNIHYHYCRSNPRDIKTD